MTSLLLPTSAINPPPTVSRSFIFQDDPRFPEVHCSTIQVASDGTHYATWFGGTKEGHADVRIWFSRRRTAASARFQEAGAGEAGKAEGDAGVGEGGGEWSRPKAIAGSDGVVHWNPVSFLPDKNSQPGWLIVYFKIGTPIPTWRTYSIDTKDGGETWSDPKELVPGDTSGGRGPQKNPPIVLSNGDWLSGSSREVTLPGGKGIWDAYADIAPAPASPSPTAQSSAGKWEQGDRWERAPFIELPGGDQRHTDNPGRWVGEGVIQPSAWEDPRAPGKVSMFLRSSNGWIQRTDSEDYGRTWSEAYDSPLPSNNSGQCVTMMRDGRLVCAYNPVPASWGPRTPLVLSISEDNGASWKLWVTLEDRPPKEGFERVVALETGIVNDGESEFSYPTLTPTDESDIVGVWVSYTWQRRGVIVAKVYDEP